jgi:hypothetical protein
VINVLAAARSLPEVMVKTRPKFKKGAFVPSADGSAGSTPTAAKERKPKVRKKKVEEQEAA